jgi:tetratricopeptide (TPR) repeat protein
MTEYSMQDLVREAEKSLDSLQPLLAAKFYTRAFEQEPHWDIAQKLGSCYFESLQSNPENYEQCLMWFQKSIELNQGQWESFLMLGQLHQGQDAVDLYRRGLSYLNPKNEDELKCYSDALCALTELYMTDLCDEDDAESNCVSFMEQALKTDPKNPEIYSTFASVRLSQCRNEEAKALLEQGMDLWYSEPPEEDSAIIIDPSWPALPVRLSLARLLIEVESYERALSILGTCQAEDDEDPQSWYLFGWCYFNVAQSNPQEAELILSDAQECLQTVLQVLCRNVAT